MKAAFLIDKKRLEIREVPVPVPKRGEVLIRLKAVGICGSDLHYYRNGHIGNEVITKPHILGHEASGEVVSLGEEVTQIRAGQKVAIEPSISCGHCETCLSGRQNICLNIRFLGLPPTLGAFREYITIPEENLYPLPESMSYEEGVMLEPLAIGIHAVELSKMNPADTIAILGCGTIGLSVLSVVKACGAGKILVTDLLEPRLAMAKKLGADYVLNAKREDVASSILKLTGKRGADIIFESAGEQETLNQAVKIAFNGGKIMIIGSPEEESFSFPAHIARRKELTIQNVRRSLRAVGKGIRLIQKKSLNLLPLITHHFPLEKIGEAFKLANSYQDGVIKVIIEM